MVWQKNCKIYIRTDAIINDNLFIHEYIHLISIKRTWYGKVILGLAKNKSLVDFNELLTEYFAYDITGIKNTLHPYNFAFPFVKFLIGKLGKEQIVRCYFGGSVNIIKQIIGNHFYKEFFNDISNVICLSKGKQYVDCQIYVNTISYLQRNSSQK